ncbi:MAG: MFS transporter [Planctomycetota bacterium]|nr:MFS transporter [Planctomycetota bacterium]
MNSHSGDSTKAVSSWRGAIRGNVLMIGLVSLFTDFSSEMIFPLLPVFLAGLLGSGRAAIYVGLMAGVAEATASLLKIFSGRISDVIGRRKILVVVGYGISTMCRPLMATATAGWHVVALRFGDRVGKGLRTSPRDALISDSAGPNVRGLAFSFHRVMDHTGAVLGPLAAVGILYVFLGELLWCGSTADPAAREMSALRWLFWIALLPGLAAMAVLIRVREIRPRPQSDRTHPHDRFNTPKRLPRRFYAFVGIATIFALGNSSDLFLVFYGKVRFGLGLGQLIGLWVALHVSKIVFSLPGGILSDRLGRRPIIIAGWAVYALVYLGMATASQPQQFWALIVIYGLYYGMTEGAAKALVADCVPGESRGTAYGLYHGAVGIAALPASLMFGVFWRFIGPQWAFGIGAALAAAAVGLMVLLSATKKR